MPRADSSPLGPVEMMLVGFSGGRFDGSIVPVLAELVEDGTIRLVDLALLRKDEEGAVEAVDLAEAGLRDGELAMLGLGRFDGPIGDLFADEDLAIVAEQLPGGAAAALILWESTWVVRLAHALADADAEVLLHDRIPAPVVADALASRSPV